MTLDDSRNSTSLSPEFRRAMRIAGLIGLCGIAICAAVWIGVALLGHRWSEGAAAFYKAYLFAWLFFLGISLGAMMVVMIHHLAGGEWGYFVRRFGEAAANVLPLLFVLFVPILIGLHRIYPWADPDNHNAVIVHKRPYLNPGFFVLRYILYFAVWIMMAWFLRTLSLRHDRTASEREARRLRVVSAVGLVAYFITMSLASVDWIMSLEPKWYSTVFGFIVCMGQGVTGTALLIIMLEIMSKKPPFVRLLRPRHFNDLATLLIVAVIMWAYNSFAQLLVTWMGNIQGEIPWYVKRSQGPWRAMAWLLVFVGFLAPFVLLLQRGIKMRGRAMFWTCCCILIMQMLNIYWMVAPGGNEPYPNLDWFNVLMSVVALIGIGGLWFFVFLWLLDGSPLIPMGDSVPIEVIPSDEQILEPRISEHGAQPGTQPGIA